VSSLCPAGLRGVELLNHLTHGPVCYSADSSLTLMRYATEANSRLLWFNFVHLFSMSLLPLSTAWMAVSELAPQPVAFHASVFLLVNATYMCLIWELIDTVTDVPLRVRRTMRFRSITTLCLFGLAAIVALRYPAVGLGICICCLIVYLRPEPPGAGASVSPLSSE
jgi:uncharacterized membrane protein